MNSVPPAASGRAATARPGRLRRLAASLAAAPALAAALAACTAPAATATAAADLGRVPIPTAPATAPVPTASDGHPQLLAIGEPVRVELPGGTAATVTALGPQEDLPSNLTTYPTQALGVIILTVRDATGPVTLNAADLSSHDETGAAITLTADGPGTATASRGTSATVHVSGTFKAGAAQITWRYHGQVLAVWDFNIELD